MKKRIINTGLIASALVVGIPALSLLFTGTGKESFEVGEYIGYGTIIVAMALIFFAIRSFKVEENQGRLSFGEGMKMGTAIAAIGGLAFAIYNYVYVVWIDPDFMEAYISYSTGLEVGSEALKEHIATAYETDPFFMSLTGQSVLMFLTVFLIGFIITVISSLILKSSIVEKVPA